MTTTIREAAPSDVPALDALIRELALYERAPDAVEATPEDLGAALFGPDPRVFCHVAESQGHVVGMALWYVTYSTWKGRHGIWLEDLYVTPDQRGRGAGQALLRTLAAECVARGYPRLEWWVLDWNEPSIGFYRSLGAVPQDEWTVFRLDGEALQRTAGGGTHA